MSSSSSSDPVIDSLDPIYDITKEDIDTIYKADGHYNPEGGAAIHEKLVQGFPVEKRSHMIMAKKYDRAFFTSDIHSDLRKFLQMLKNNRLIGTSILAYDETAIYDPALIVDSEWMGGERTILVIIGDLVDGKRLQSVQDSRGSFEFLLFALLYNLRRKANRVGSEILFTLGNHEYESIIRASVIKGPSIYYKDYVTDEVKKFFDYNEKLRSQALLPFLRTSPYYMLTFTTKNIELLCVHGGFHHEKRGYNLFDMLFVPQDNLDTGKRDLDMFDPVIDEALQTRIYNRPGGFCDNLVKPSGTIGDQLSDFRLTIVGHCPTSGYHRSLELIRSDPRYEGCDDGRGEAYPVGCVVVDCEGSKDGAPDGAPRLAFVDTAMSNAFRPSAEENDTRQTQMLLLTHDPALEDDKRYFNKIERVARVGQSGLDEKLSTVLYAAPLKSSSSANATTSSSSTESNSSAKAVPESASSSSSSSSTAVVENVSAPSTKGGRRSKRTRRTVKKHNLKKRRNSRKLTSSRRTRRTVVRRL